LDMRVIRIYCKLDHWLQHEIRMQPMTVRRRNEVELEKAKISLKE
jgi:hypothetical protein